MICSCDAVSCNMNMTGIDSGIKDTMLAALPYFKQRELE